MSKKACFTFEDRVELQCRRYITRLQGRILKHDPPVQVVGGKRPRVVFKPGNPFVDFHGHFIVDGVARPIAFDAKTTTAARLNFSERGLKDAQLDILDQEHYLGAVVGVLWQYDRAVKWFTWAAIVEARARRSSIPWDVGIPVAEQPFPDFLPVAINNH